MVRACAATTALLTSTKARYSVHRLRGGLTVVQPAGSAAVSRPWRANSPRSAVQRVVASGDTAGGGLPSSRAIASVAVWRPAASKSTTLPAARPRPTKLPNRP